MTPEIIERAAQLSAEGKSRNEVREKLLEEFGVNVSRPAIIEALQRREGKILRVEAEKRVEAHEARLSADAARAVAEQMAAEGLPDDTKLIKLRLAALVGRSNASWDAMKDREKGSFRTWAKLEDLVLKTLVLKLKLGGALKEDDDLDAVDRALTAKLDKLKKPPGPT